MKFPPKCYFCGKDIDLKVWVETTSPSGYAITVACCKACAKERGQ